jgi:hypothetical protein
MAVLGWAGLLLLMSSTLPTVGPRWLFFFFWTLAVTGSALPFVWLLHRRFLGARPVAPQVMLRRGLGIGLYGATCAWLQVNRSLSLSLAVFILIGLLAFEWLLTILERSTWRPSR